MSEQEKFLSRWSRRKLEGADETPAADETSPAKPEQRDPQATKTVALPPEAAQDDAPGFDLSKLPSLDSIGPDSDIRAFLQPGVPGALSRAALRRAWSADPAIRDFIGLAENQWDFTATDSITGFGPLDPQEAAQHLAKFLGRELSKPAGPEAAETEAPEAQAPQNEPATASVEHKPAVPLEPVEPPAPSAPNEQTAEAGEDADAASQQERPVEVAVRRRSHGGALPE